MSKLLYRNSFIRTSAFRWKVLVTSALRINPVKHLNMALQSYGLPSPNRHLNRFTNVTTGLETDKTMVWLKPGPRLALHYFWISGNIGILNTGTIDPEVHMQLVLQVKKKALKITFIESPPSTFFRNLRCSTWSSRKSLISLFKYHLWHYPSVSKILIWRYYLGNTLRRNKSLKFLNFADLLPFIYYFQMLYVGSRLLFYRC